MERYWTIAAALATLTARRDDHTARPSRRRYLSAFVLTTAALVGSSALAAPTARELLDEARRLNDTTRRWNDLSEHYSIRIVETSGSERTRELDVRTLRADDGEEKTLSVFSEPAEIRGTAFLQFAHRDGDADQWLYLPELERVRQITSRAKDENFMGTDFSYRDLELINDVLEWNETQAHATLLRSEASEGGEQHTIQLVPREREIGYKRLVIVLSTPDFVLRRIDFFGEEDEPVKVLRREKVETIDGMPTALHMEMQTSGGGRTIVDVSRVRYNQSLPESLFTRRSLERGVELSP